MNDMKFVVATLALSFATLASGCGDDRASDGSSNGESNEETNSDTDTDTDSNTDSQSESAGMDQGGDGDGDSGDGDGDSGDGDGDSGNGDGDGDSGNGDGDGDSGNGDGDGDSGNGDGDGDSGDGDTDTNTDTDTCDEFEGVVEAVPPSVMFLLDRSGSMNDVGFDLNAPDKSRWNSLYESVEAVISNGADETIAFGAKTFSTYNFGECGVSDGADVEIAINNSEALLAGIPGPLEFIVGGTPTNLAIEKTLAIMQNHDAQGGSKIVFLVTDGLISCTDDHAQSLADAVADLSSGYEDDEITTYVVGIAPSDSNMVTNQLHEMAIAGGAPKDGEEGFYRADDAQELADALAAVVEESFGSSCLLSLEQPPQFPEFTQVVVGDNEYDLVQDCDNEDGFIYTNMDYSQIRVCGTACEEFQMEQAALVQYFCMLQ